LASETRHGTGDIHTIKPDIELARRMPREYHEFSNVLLLKMASYGDQNAKEERLIRDIMTVDNCSWDAAQPRFLEIERVNKEGRWLVQMPYYLGIGVAYTAAFASIPLCFSLTTAQWFNDAFVTADAPEPEEIETMLEVGSWTWGWMEPPLGQISFFILCLQFSRDRMINLGWQPYTLYIRNTRAQRIMQLYPQYNSKIMKDYALGDWFDPTNDH
jgi:hypothetical protein